MRYEAILFDMDGTVLYTLEDLHAAINAALAPFGMPALTLSQVRACVGNGSARLVELAVPEGTSEETRQAVLEHYAPGRIRPDI